MDKKQNMKRFGLSLKRDGNYAKLIIFAASILSGFSMGLQLAQEIFTSVWKIEYGFSFK